MEAKTILVQEQKKKELTEKIAEALKKAKQKKELRNLAVFGVLLASATIGRIALQWIPSVEPIIPLAVLAGLLFGMREGSILGASAYVFSNFFVWGLQGPWTVFQAIGAAVPGAVAGLFGRARKPSWKTLVVLSVLGTVFFEIVMNISGAMLGIGLFGLGLLAIPLYFVSSLPFSLAHIASNAAFARVLGPALKLWRKEDEFKMVSYSKFDSGGSSTVRVYKSDS